MTIVCHGCGFDSESQPKAGLSLGENKPEGWGHVFDQSNGLETRWFCDDCSDKLRRLADDIMTILKLDNFYFKGLLRLPKKLYDYD